MEAYKLWKHNKDLKKLPLDKQLDEAIKIVDPNLTLSEEEFTKAIKKYTDKLDKRTYWPSIKVALTSFLKNSGRDLFNNWILPNAAERLRRLNRRNEFNAYHNGDVPPLLKNPNVKSDIKIKSDNEPLNNEELKFEDMTLEDVLEGDDKRVKDIAKMVTNNQAWSDVDEWVLLSLIDEYRNNPSEDLKKHIATQLNSMITTGNTLADALTLDPNVVDFKYKWFMKQHPELVDITSKIAHKYIGGANFYNSETTSLTPLGDAPGYITLSDARAMDQISLDRAMLSDTSLEAIEPIDVKKPLTLLKHLYPKSRKVVLDELTSLPAPLNVMYDKYLSDAEDVNEETINLPKNSNTAALEDLSEVEKRTLLNKARNTYIIKNNIDKDMLKNLIKYFGSSILSLSTTALNLNPIASIASKLALEILLNKDTYAKAMSDNEGSGGIFDKYVKTPLKIFYNSGVLSWLALTKGLPNFLSYLGKTLSPDHTRWLMSHLGNVMTWITDKLKYTGIPYLARLLTTDKEGIVGPLSQMSRNMVTAALLEYDLGKALYEGVKANSNDKASSDAFKALFEDELKSLHNKMIKTAPTSNVKGHSKDAPSKDYDDFLNFKFLKDDANVNTYDDFLNFKFLKDDASLRSTDVNANDDFLSLKFLNEA